MSTTNPLGEKSTFEVGPAPRPFDGVDRVDGLTTHYGYDTFGRQTRIGPGRRRDHYLLPGLRTSGIERVMTTVADGSKSGLWQTTWFDGMGRASTIVRKGATATIADLTATTYSGASGLVAGQTRWVSIPAPVGGIEPNAPAGTPATAYQYDEDFGRQVSVTDPMGNTITNSSTCDV